MLKCVIPHINTAVSCIPLLFEKFGTHVIIIQCFRFYSVTLVVQYNVICCLNFKLKSVWNYTKIKFLAKHHLCLIFLQYYFQSCYTSLSLLFGIKFPLSTNLDLDKISHSDFNMEMEIRGSRLMIKC